MPSCPDLPSDEVHVWASSIDQSPDSVAKLESLLSREETERLARYRDAKARRQFCVARALLRSLLGCYLRIHPASVSFQLSKRGKPGLAATHAEDIRFNLTHSGEWVLLAFARGRNVGIDVEQVVALDEMKAIAERFFTPAEASQIKGKQAAREELFFEHWTRKEAVLKCIGCGIDDDYQRQAAQFTGTVCRLCLDIRYLGALAVDGGFFALRTFSWVAESAYRKTTSTVPFP
jgi:4'-phosphopantetheinyl transferase